MNRVLVTSALPYINGVKHLGNLVGSMLPADVYARYLRRRGRDVLFICATDEHGTPAELAAHEAGLDVAEYCRIQHGIQADLARRFQLSFDHFGRTSSAQNADLTRHFAQKLDEQGYLEERSTRQIYSPDDGRFLPDRYVVGTCPRCGYEAARGDQCESCTRVLDPTDLIAPRSAISGSTNLEVRESRHLFLLQSKLVDRLRSWITSHDEWPPLVTSIALKWLNEGLRDRCITRDLKWGVPVDRVGLEGKVFYVWFDAPIGYLGATAEWADREKGRDWRSWWLEAEDVRYVQFMAKDNIPFHTIGFPSTIMGSGEPWKMVDFVKGFSWLNYYGGKFSTSSRRGVFMDHALELLPADYWRYYLIANAPESDDSDFTWEHFQAVVNKDLADTLGNFVNRTLRLAMSRFDGRVPSGGEPGSMEAELVADLEERVRAYERFLEQLSFRKAAGELRAIWTAGNVYVTRAAPWTAFKTDVLRAAATVRTSLNLVRLFAILSEPVIPEASARILGAVGAQSGATWPESLEDAISFLPAGHVLAAAPDMLFRKITDEEIAAWRARFAGSEQPKEPAGGSR
jgi:methionyl-tRNA synthetase